MQPIEKHIDLVLIKFRAAGGYSELSQDSLRAAIRDYLLEIHDRDMETLGVQMDIEQQLGKTIDQAFYKKEYTKIKNNLNDRIKELSYMGDHETQKLLT